MIALIKALELFLMAPLASLYEGMDDYSIYYIIRWVQYQYQPVTKKKQQLTNKIEDNNDVLELSLIKLKIYKICGLQYL
jgi:hypothetical protein